MSTEAKCECQHCGEHIAFPSEAAGQTLTCPHCGKETILTLPVAPEEKAARFYVWEKDQQTGPFDEKTIQELILQGRIKSDTLLALEEEDMDWTPANQLFLMDSEPETPPEPAASVPDATVTIRLHSGQELKIKAIWLYDAKALTAVGVKKREALDKLPGVGVAGSSEWVLTSSVIIDSVEGVVSADSVSASGDLLSQAVKMERDLRKKGVSCPVQEIENIDLPNPETWRCRSPKLPAVLVYDGGYFLTVQTDEGVQSIRWSAVESYAYQG